jgi:hypothetical protein
MPALVTVLVLAQRALSLHRLDTMLRDAPADRE